MMTVIKLSIYDNLVKITDVYLGPASTRFINRQIVNHLQKRPNDIDGKDLLRLIEWIQVVVSLLTNDEEVVADYISEVRKLSAAQAAE